MDFESVKLIAVPCILFLKLIWIWMLIDCAINEPSGSDKIAWIVVMVFTGCIGGLIYFFMRRPRRIEKFGK